MPLSIFDTYYMLGQIQEIVPAQTFFRDRYFPTGAEDVFAADKVLVEYEDGDRRLAPFVVRRAGDIPIARGGYEVHEFEPPYIAPSRLLTLDDLRRRGFGEAVLPTITQAERATALQLRDLTALDLRITRREEWMAAQTLIMNGCEMRAFIDNKDDAEIYDVFYYDTSGSNPAMYTVANTWDSPGGDFWADVEAMCADLADRGLAATDLVVGSAVGNFILDDEKAMKRLDNRRMEFGQYAPRIESPGAAWLGRLNFGGFELDIFSVRESYVDVDGTSKLFFPAKSALVTAPGCGRMMYGQVTQIEEDNEFHTFAMSRVPKFVADREKDTRKLRLASRPLAAPRQKAPWMYAADVLS